ncbi:hypothetical protein C3L33_20619, partial [Rhododendron williamsianum]
MNETDTICGVDLKNGTVCRRQPLVGRKRCEEHKGMRVTGSKSMLLAAGDIPLAEDGWNRATRIAAPSKVETGLLNGKIDLAWRSRPRLVSVKYDFDEDHASTSGTSKLIIDGKSPIDDESTVDSGVDATSLCYDKVKPQPITDSFPVGNISFLIYGITSDDSTLCRKQLAQGRRRGEEHKGRKIP